MADINGRKITSFPASDSFGLRRQWWRWWWWLPGVLVELARSLLPNTTVYLLNQARAAGGRIAGGPAGVYAPIEQ